MALGNKSAEVFSYLIKQNVDVQKINNEGNTPLMNSAERNNTVALSSLYELTKDKTLVNEEGYSLLTYAVRTRNSGLAERVLKAGLDFEIVDKSGDNLITHLVDTFDDKDKEFFEHYFKVLNGKKVEIQNKTIHLATAVESEYLVNILLKSGININAKNKDGITALQLAAMKGDHTEFLKFLISKGAEKGVKTDFDETVYDLARSNELLEGDLEFLKQ